MTETEEEEEEEDSRSQLENGVGETFTVGKYSVADKKERGEKVDKGKGGERR